MSTLISDLGDTPASGDSDFVQNILNEINVGSDGGGGGGAPHPSHAPPAVGGGNHTGGMIHAPNPNTMGQRLNDNGPITAHMIGNSHPTPADFAQVIGQGGHGGGAPGFMPAPQGQWAGAATYQAPQQPTYVPPPAKKSWLTRVADELRTACFVAILVFIFSLPVVNFLFAHYVPSMVKSTGELTLVGLLVKSLAAGGAFMVLQKIVVPLLSL